MRDVPVIQSSFDVVQQTGEPQTAVQLATAPPSTVVIPAAEAVMDTVKENTAAAGLLALGTGEAKAADAVLDVLLPGPERSHRSATPGAEKGPVGFLALPETAQHLVLCSLSAADLWALCRTSATTRDSVQHNFHAWIKEAPLYHGVPIPGQPTKGPQEANLPLAHLAFVLGLGNPSPGSEQWRSFRKLYRRYGAINSTPSPLAMADVIDARRGPMGWDPRDWNSPAYDHLMNDLPPYLIARPLCFRIREALGQLVWSMVYWMCDGGGDLYYLKRWPARVRSQESPEDLRGLGQGPTRDHFAAPRVFPAPLPANDESNEVDDPEEKPSPHAEESPVLRFLRIRRYMDRCWDLIWRFGGPLPSEIIKGVIEPPSKRQKKLPIDSSETLHAHALDSFASPGSVCSKNLYPRMLLNLIKRGDYRTLSLMLSVFGRPEKEWRTDLRRRAAAETENALGFAQAATQQNNNNENNNSGGKESCADGGIRFNTPPGHVGPPQWIVWFTQKGSGGPHIGFDGDWERTTPLCEKIDRAIRFHGGVLGRAPIPELPAGGFEGIAGLGVGVAFGMN